MKLNTEAQRPALGNRDQRRKECRIATVALSARRESNLYIHSVVTPVEPTAGHRKLRYAFLTVLVPEFRESAPENSSDGRSFSESDI